MPAISMGELGQILLKVRKKYYKAETLYTCLYMLHGSPKKKSPIDLMTGTIFSVAFSF